MTHVKETQEINGQAEAGESTGQAPFLLSDQELETAGRETLIRAYRQLREKYLEQNCILAEKDRLWKNAAERLRLQAVNEFGSKTEKLSTLEGDSSASGMDGSCAPKKKAADEKTDDGDDENADDDDEDGTEENGKEKEKPRRKKGCAEAVWGKLPTVYEDVTLTPEQVHAAIGGGRYSEFRPQETSTVVYIPGMYVRIVTRIHVYKNKRKIVRASDVKKPKLGSIFSSSVGAALLESKFCLGLPTNRYTHKCAMDQFHISRQTASQWIIDMGIDLFDDVAARLRQHLAATGRIQMDETPVIVVRDYSTDNLENRFWVMINSELDRESPQAVVFIYDATRSTDVLRELFEDVDCTKKLTITCDGYASYQTFGREHPDFVVIAGCLVHCRRYFSDVIKAIPGFKDLSRKKKKKFIAYQALRKLKKIFHEEHSLLELSADERLAGRKEKVEPLVDEFFAWLHSIGQEETDQGSLLAKATGYALNQETYLKEFLKDGYIPICNSACERHILPVAIGRNGWKTISSVDGAIAAANCYSIAETAKVNGAHPYYYFKYLLEKLPELKAEHEKDKKENGRKDLSYLDGIMPWSEDYRKYESAEMERNREIMCRAAESLLAVEKQTA